ncbi:MAG: hypothetical protein EOO12_12690 [Chitinophagaceae bacterium]|nr:MAG: hypothetical protein EOO12_12690 [Chitinophagaceae bacterium]
MQLHTLRLPLPRLGDFLAPVSRSAYYESLIGDSLPGLYRELSGSFPFRHACTASLEAPGLRFGSSPLQVALQLGLPRHVQKLEGVRIALYGSRCGRRGAYVICHFVKGRLALVQQVFPAFSYAGTEVAALLAQQYGLRLPAQEEDFLLFNAAGQRLVVRRDRSVQLFYLGGEGLPALSDGLPHRTTWYATHH